MLLKKCYKALPKGGSVILFNMMQTDNEDGPLTAAMARPTSCSGNWRGHALYNEGICELDEESGIQDG